MPKHELVTAKDWRVGDRVIPAGEVVGEIESEFAPMLLVEGERTGRVQVRTPPTAPSPNPSNDDPGDDEPTDPDA